MLFRQWNVFCTFTLPVPVAARSKAYVCGHARAEIVGSNATGGMNVCLSVVSVVCCQVELSCDELITCPGESHWLWCVVVCDLETSWTRRIWPIRGLSRQKNQKTYFIGRRNIAKNPRPSNQCPGVFPRMRSFKTPKPEGVMDFTVWEERVCNESFPLLV